MSGRLKIEVPLNRVEGDLELRVELAEGVVTDAWSSGVMYRGFENILVGRGALDGLVITPRICGICSTAHLTAAALALESVAGIQASRNAARIRDLCLMTEMLQSDLRHAFLMFAADFANPYYRDSPLYSEIVRRYEPLRGETVTETIQETKRVIQIIAILGGQWPHSSYMVPGGVTSRPTSGDLLQCRHLLNRYRDWYERRVLGCSLERWQAVRSKADLDAWLDEQPSHHNSELGFYIRFARQRGFHRMGRGSGAFLSVGSQLVADGDEEGRCGQQTFPAGFARGVEVGEFCQTRIAEHVSHSWFVDYEGGRHPMEGETRPYATGQEGRKYSWSKAPRYEDMPAETGPLAELLVSRHPLFRDLVGQSGASVFVRQLARIVRQTELLPVMDRWICETPPDGKFYESTGPIPDGEGVGLVQAPRGALGHWVRIANGKIDHYQIITPTAWNASPRDSDGVKGPWEQAVVGTEIKDPDNPVELGHVVRSFDACLVCTVH